MQVPGPLVYGPVLHFHHRGLFFGRVPDFGRPPEAEAGRYRDAALAKLEELGYLARKAQSVDLFPRTAHVETVVLMTRKDA